MVVDTVRSSAAEVQTPFLQGSVMRHPATLITFDNVDFASAWDLQRRLVHERAAGRCPDTVKSSCKQ